MDTSGQLTHVIRYDLHSKDERVRNAAAQQVWDQYSADLLRIAHSNLADWFRSKVSDESIVQDVFLAFFRQAREAPGLVITDRHHARNLLIHMVLCRASNGAERWQTQSRDARKDQLRIPVGASDKAAVPIELLEKLAASGPSPEDGCMLKELLQSLAEQLDKPVADVLSLWSEGLSDDEIAKKLNISVRAVRRRREVIRRVA